MLHDILFALWFMLPVAGANVTPIFSAATPGLRHLNAPIDNGRTFRGKRIFGSHKTWRGLVTGIIAATLTLWLQQEAVSHYHWARELAGGVDYSALSTLILGPLFGIGALGGDAAKSFFKRQRGIEPGRSWLPFDQLDYIIGGVLVSLPFVTVSAPRYAWIAVIWFLMHLLASFIGGSVGLKERRL
jgi:CDP-2,3-bis-(O-geranylgeranyl)-sn-glycerol synthase